MMPGYMPPGTGPVSSLWSENGEDGQAVALLRMRGDDESGPLVLASDWSVAAIVAEEMSAPRMDGVDYSEAGIRAQGDSETAVRAADSSGGVL